MGRPPVVAEVAKPGHEPVDLYSLKYYRHVSGQWGEQLALIDRWLDSTDFLADTMPSVGPDLGPDQFGASIGRGAELTFSKDSKATNWMDHWVDEWNAALPMELNEASPTWSKLIALSERMREHAQGRYLVATCDLHSNMDALLAIRGGMNLSMDFYDCPELLDRAMAEVRKLYPPIYDRLYEAGGMGGELGCTSWCPFWSDGKLATIQCDYICMIGPEHFRRYVLPALEEEAAFLDRTIFHLDGPGALVHLDDVLAIEHLDCLEWTSGDGQKPMWQWMDVLKAAEKAGKSNMVYDIDAEQVKTVHPQLDPAKVGYMVRVDSREECEDLLKWLEANS
jgi:hypothetical protein